MRAVAFNGSGRKHFNTATLLQAALDGAATVGASPTLYHLHDHPGRGCRGCLVCKKRHPPVSGRCALNDAFTPLIEDALAADVILLGSPVYFYTESAMFRCFFERLLYPLTRYTHTDRSLYTGHARVALIYTMNMTEEEARHREPPFPDEFRLDIMRQSAFFVNRIFGNCQTLVSADTLQVRDYSAYAIETYDPDHKARRYAEVFPEDCRKAFELGRNLASGT